MEKKKKNYPHDDTLQEDTLAFEKNKEIWRSHMTKALYANRLLKTKLNLELSEHLKSPTFNHDTSIKSFDFSTLYTIIPHQKLKNRLMSIIRNVFIFKNGNRRYKYLVLGHDKTYFVKGHSDSKNKYSDDDIINMLEFLVDNTFVDSARSLSADSWHSNVYELCLLFSPTSFCILTKRNSYSLCSQRERNS